MAATDDGFAKTSRERYGRSLAVAIVTILIDQATKELIRRTVAPGESLPVIQGMFDITHTFNTGAAFGFLGGSSPSFTRPFLIAVSLLAIGFLAYTLVQVKQMTRLTSIAIGLLVGGASGNLLDRILFGGVTDFLDFHWKGAHWPAFNVADSSITIGVVLLLFLMPRAERKSR